MFRLLIASLLSVYVVSAASAAQQNQLCDQYDDLQTTTPAPPTIPYRWKVYDTEYKNIPNGSVDLVIVGDSLAEFWNTDMWRPLRAYNAGIATERTQNTLWRLNQPNWAKMHPKAALLTVGSNNMVGSDKPCAIMQGIKAVLNRMRVLWPDAKIGVLEIPPRAPDWGLGQNAAKSDDTRRLINGMIEGLPGIVPFNIDKELLCDGKMPCDNYKPDNTHFTDSGYRILMHQMRPALGLGSPGGDR